MEIQSSGTLRSTSESIKTESSRSDASDIAKEDLTKDNSASPIDLECRIQVDRITKILEEAIFKTKLAICLPHFVNDFTTLSSILTPSDLDDLVIIFKQYENPLLSTSLTCVTAMDSLKAGDMSIKTRLNPELSHLLYILNSYPALKPITDQIINEMKMNVAKIEYHPSRPALNYLIALEKLKELIVVQVALTAADEWAMKFNTRKLENSNEKLIANLNEISGNLKNDSEKFETMMKQKEEKIANLERELAFLNHDAQMLLKRKILDSERQMVVASRAHAVKDEILQEEEKESKETYDQHLRAHLLVEKNQRARRFKVETQLMSWVQKYDVEMGDKQIELDEFTEKYDEEVDKCEVLEGKLAEQDKEYLPLMEEREAEYQQELTNKMNAFLQEHAARVIQCAWREVLSNRADKKRSKGKGRKVEQAKEENGSSSHFILAEAQERKAALAAKKAEAEAKKAEAAARKAEEAARKAEKKAAAAVAAQEEAAK